MIGGTIYTRGRAAFTGGSPQAVFEELWLRERKSRLRTRAIIAGIALIVCGYAVSPLFGVLAGALAGGIDAAVHWWRYRSAGVWRRGLRGEERMARILRWTLERRGYRALHQRVVPGYGTVDTLLVGPTGIWLIDNQAYHPDTEITEHGGRLFIDDRTQSQLVKRLNGAARQAAETLTARLVAGEVTVTPMLAVHGGKVRRRRFVADGIVVGTPWRLLRWPAHDPTDELSPKRIEEIWRAAVYSLPIGGRTMTDA
ncbi:nuclease-related domain-containing protein [Thermomonospora amylolytica]|uniref:nuclease-related domain-containing protein n=1 Tax=Thermomonospora amylolytica TaxID=1411117 RepID=UPI000E6C1A22|nr:nuclease-related domain-containing protein [Thermomonospora amylolytica]